MVHSRRHDDDWRRTEWFDEDARNYGLGDDLGSGNFQDVDWDYAGQRSQSGRGRDYGPQDRYARASEERYGRRFDERYGRGREERFARPGRGGSGGHREDDRFTGGRGGYRGQGYGPDREARFRDEGYFRDPGRRFGSQRYVQPYEDQGYGGGPVWRGTPYPTAYGFDPANRGVGQGFIEPFGRARDWGGHDERGFFERASDEISSWFGDEDAEHRRRDDGHRGRGPKNYTRSSERIREDVSDRLTDDWWVDARDIEVGVTGAEVTLSGTVENREQRHRAEDIAEHVSGVKHVQNNLRVHDRNSEQRASEQRASTSSGGSDIAASRSSQTGSGSGR